METALVTNVQPYSIHDGPGIRTTVFMKGCPLRCMWCDNPETQVKSPELTYIATRCIGCGECLKVCPNGAISIGSNGKPKTDRTLCKNCGECVTVCLTGAREIVGKPMTVDELLGEVEKDRAFYARSGGGVTLSGGEPLMHPEFTREFLEKCRKINIHTAIESCGYVEWEIMRKSLEHLDLFLYDIKHMDPVKHIELTSVPNQLILKNIERVSRLERRPALIIRFPLIPGINDSEENVNATAKFMVETLGGINRLDILPYHQLGTAKYDALDREYKLKDLLPPEKDYIQQIKEKFEIHGLEVKIGG